MYSSITKNQSRIPNYFKIISDIEVVVNENKKLYESIQNLQEELNQKNEENNKPKSTSEILNLLIQTAQNQLNKKNGGFRYNETIKEFASYMFMLAGRIAYETLCKNIPLPSLSSISRYLQEKGPTIIEGNLRSTELLEYLEKRKLPLQVWLSEDATRVTGRIQYDSKTNQLVGFVLPLDGNGMPIQMSFMARSAKEIEDHFMKESTANQVKNFCCCMKHANTTGYKQLFYRILLIFCCQYNFFKCSNYSDYKQSIMKIIKFI